MDELNPEAIIPKTKPNIIWQLAHKNKKSILKYSKLIYAKKEARDIKSYIRQVQELKKKSKKQQQERQLKQEKQAKGYDENELKEYEFNFKLGNFKEKINSPKKQQKLLKNLKSAEKKFSVVESGRRRQTIGAIIPLPIITNFKDLRATSNERYKKSFSVKSPTKTNKKQKKTYEEEEKVRVRILEEKIKIKSEQMKKFMNNIADFIKGYERRKDDFYIQNKEINKKIMERYRVKQTSVGSKMFEIDYISLPFCEFVGEADAKKSINRIFNIPIETTHKIAFKIFDRNANGTIDEKDIIQLFDLSEENDAVKEDLNVIIKNFNVSLKDKLLENKSKVQNFSDLSEISLTTLERSKPTGAENFRFQKEKFFSFLESKEKFYQKKQKMKVSLTLNQFQAAFAGRRPKVFIDILNYLFGLDAEDVFENDSSHPKNIFGKFKIFEAMGRSLARRNRKAKTEEIERMSTEKMEHLMKKATSIYQFDTCKL